MAHGGHRFVAWLGRSEVMADFAAEGKSATEEGKIGKNREKLCNLYAIIQFIFHPLFRGKNNDHCIDSRIYEITQRDING